MSDFTDLVELELAAARTKFFALHSGHEAFGVIYEELDEFWDEVKRQDRDPDAMLKELVQTAAMCARAAEDLGLIK
jgi:hypothetical protein